MRTRGRNRRWRPNWPKIAISTTALLLSPVLASGIIRFVPAVTAAAERAAIVSAGLALTEGGRLVLGGAPSESSSSDIPDEDTEHGELPLIGEGSNLVVGGEQTTAPPAETTAPPTDPALLAEGNHDGTILYVHYGPQTGNNYLTLPRGGQVKNSTSVPMDTLKTESEKLPEFKIAVGSSEPQVLLMHTHTTESFEPYERDYFDNSFGSRTTDMSRNMAAVGDVVAAQLTAAGINVVHDKTIHDYPSYTGAYERSAETVKGILAQYPSIKVVLDLHRDAIERDAGTHVAPYAEIGGRKAAQVMIISGADDGTMNMPNYLQNFRLASLLQQQMESDNPGLMRPVMFDYRQYNQDLTTGSLLIEIGGHANSFDQAAYSGELLGKSLAKALSSLQ